MLYYRCELYGGLKDQFVKYFKSFKSCLAFGYRYLVTGKCQSLTDHLYFEVFEVNLPSSVKRVYTSD